MRSAVDSWHDLVTVVGPDCGWRRKWWRTRQPGSPLWGQPSVGLGSVARMFAARGSRGSREWGHGRMLRPPRGRTAVGSTVMRV